MIDGIIKADGTSRLMRANLPATYEEFKAQAAAGTLPLDVLFNADGWSQLPTFLNKNNLLRDNTADLFGLNADAVPDDVLRVLSRFQNGLGNEYVWAKVLSQTGCVEDRVDYSSRIENYTVYCADSYTLNEETCLFTLVNPESIYVSSSIPSTLVGKYICFDSVANKSEIYYVTSVSGTTYYAKKLTASIKTAGTNYGYVNSPDPNAYPPAVSDGYTYTALGQLGNKVQIATGSYTGTGTYGASNPNSIAFDFEPKLVFMVAETSGLNYSELSPTAIGTRGMVIPFYLMGTSYANSWGFTSNTSYSSYGKRDGNTMYWYNDKSASYQLNGSGQTFYWLAIG